MLRQVWWYEVRGTMYRTNWVTYLLHMVTQFVPSLYLQRLSLSCFVRSNVGQQLSGWSQRLLVMGWNGAVANTVEDVQIDVLGSMTWQDQ